MKRLQGAIGGAAAVTTAALLLAACGGSGPKSSTSATTAPSSAKKVKGGTATFALPAGQVPNYMFPMESLAYFTTTNAMLQGPLYRPLYWFGRAGKPVLDESLSLADPPVWSANGKTLTIRLKHSMWSDGEPVSAQDVKLWQNMVTAEKTNWAAYVPGSYPDNVTGSKVVNPTTIQFTLNKAWNHRWFLYNELSQITPLPQAWDVTSVGAKPGSGGCTTDMAKCPAVYNFLTSQSKQVHTFATSPLWKVVDGPWRLKEYQTTGYSVFVPNTKYSGPAKPSLSKFIELPYTTESAEFNDITSGKGPDVGYIPYSDLAQLSRVTSLGYTMSPWTGWEINYFSENFNGPKGPIFRQLYVRQALQYVMDQPEVIKAIYHGYAYPTYGPVPIKPANSYASAYSKTNPYPFSVSKAKHLITSHGWKIEHGVATCVKPGTGSTDCGAGIAAGEKMTFNLQYESGVPEITQSMESYKSNAAQAGIVFNLTEAPFDTVVANAAPCKPGPKCSWQMENWGAGWIYAPDYYPTGDEIFVTGAGSNSGSYSDATNNANILATQLAPASKTQSALTRYQNYLTKQLPVIWQPLPYFQLTLIKKGLHGVTPQSPLINITPENWYYTK